MAMYQRLATPRELFYGIKPDGTIITSCVHMQINSLEQITYEQFRTCLRHLIRSYPYFRENLTLGKNEDFWVTLHKNPQLSMADVTNIKRNGKEIIHDIINSRHKAEVIVPFHFYYIYDGQEKETSESEINKVNYHLYQLVFIFQTGRLDDYSCGIVCNLFLNNLDNILQNKQLESYSESDDDVIGIKLNKDICDQKFILLKTIGREKAFKSQKLNIFDGFFTNFRFPSSNKAAINASGNNDIRVIYLTSKIILPKELTDRFLSIRSTHSIGIYPLLIVAFNLVLSRYAKETGFSEDALTLKVLHNINTKYIYETNNEKLYLQPGSHMLPFPHYFNILLNDPENLLEKAKIFTKFLEELIIPPAVFELEVYRNIMIDDIRVSYISGLWNPKYFYSFSHLDFFDEIYRDRKLNCFYMSKYDRSRPVQITGCMDVTSYILNEQLNVCIDYSTKHVSEEEIIKLLNMFQETISSFLQNIETKS